MELRFFCPACAAYNKFRDVRADSVCQCGLCKKNIPLYPNEDFRERSQLTQCLLCQKNYFYDHRDFNKGLGCAILLVAIVLSIWTYGLSLMAAALLDYVLFKRLQKIVVCYVCDSEYKGTGTVAPEFDLHLHEKYRKYRDEYAAKNTF